MGHPARAPGVPGETAQAPRGLGALGAWVSRTFKVLIVIGTGVLLGQQYVAPDKRVIPLMLSVVVIGLAWRLDMVTAIGILFVALPYPRSTTFGTTNLAFILLLIIFWLVRVSSRQLPAPRRSPIDVPLLGLVTIYVLSFNNVRGPFALDYAIRNFEIFLGSVFMYFLVTNNIRTERDLRRIHNAQLACAFTVFLVALWELNHPGQTFIPGWISFSHTVGSEFNTRNVRVGATFYDFELLSEFSAITLLLVVFRWFRARNPNERGLYSLFALLNMFVLFATVTRGAIISLAVTIPVLLWSTRRRLKIVPFTVATAAIIGLFAGMDFYVAHYTRSGDMFARLAGTKVVGGWMPDSRADAWTNAWKRALVHPLIGQGPFYTHLPGYDLTWPHCVYLYYANIVGFIGLGFFLLILLMFVRMTRPRVDDLARAPYAEAYLIIAQAQLVLFAVNEIKIDYLRNSIYQMVVWAMFSVWTAAYQVARNPAPSLSAPPT
jgi:hypothetical protein